MEIISEGKSRQVLATEAPDRVLVVHKDNETAYNGIKRATIPGKGVTINRISAILYEALDRGGVPTHFIRTVDDRSQLCLRVEPLRLEFIVRNVAAGDMTTRMDIPKGTELREPVIECRYKNDTLDDPFINSNYAVAFGIASNDELRQVEEKLYRINDILLDIFGRVGIVLVDFKVEFGRTDDGRLLMCDELSPDTCRLWDKASGESLDRDRFRYDMGRVGESYAEVLERLVYLQNHKS